MTDTVHEQVYSDVIETYVDAGMLRLLEWFNLNGMRTYFSCQGMCDGDHVANAYIVLHKNSLSQVRRLEELTPEMRFMYSPSPRFGCQVTQGKVKVDLPDTRKRIKVSFNPADLNRLTNLWSSLTKRDLRSSADSGTVESTDQT